MDRYKAAKVASILGMLGNVFLMVIKGLIAFTTSSQAMLSDTLNSAGDIVSSVMSFIGNKIASKSPDEDHNLGHGKAEYIFSLLISIVMMLFSASVLKSSIESIYKPTTFNFSYMLIVVCIITIITKFSLYIYTKNIAKKYNNLLIEAASCDHRNDCVLTTLNLIAQIASLKGITYIDGIVGALVSIWIIYSAIKLFKEAYDVLMDKGIDESVKEEILEIVKKYPEIKKINHLNSTPIGYQYQVSLTIFLDGNLSTFSSHEIANKLEKDISALDEIYLTVIHVNPIIVKKSKYKK